ncbi:MULTISPECIES: aldehyde ferredoxin oxidoreductase family protein [Halolamina]|uniref:Aldehyde:ferredoxin oxidoreductase n=1 Tax=Halolamina pelagica TaxID=699431 RepID=A0A1I5NSJ9_9EURY|nr:MULTISPECIES: aldehyde ferredoxin oxidoreductase C-terminal domain-containing protein [Halolamina]NHX36439.1 aldehyde ferredoxin oxidoreductase [Halolamina sp. R1-12]SFP24266.1 aldehyde:ferredoxin oxidoreductase [Halolamina pelagica]
MQRESVLRVDLTRGVASRETVPERWRRRYLGGKGLGARYLYDELSAGADPLGPENRLCFALGPLSGYLPGETRYAAVTKSPLTGGFLDSYAGGQFPLALAGALPDCLAVIVQGAADEPTTLVVEDGDAELVPAENWGADTVETAEAYPDASVACIGPAGENEVAYATVASDAGDHHAGRGGVGAVMGAKRLKAVVARGDRPEIPPAIQQLRERTDAEYADHATGRWQAASGTLESVEFADEVGALATEGWQAGRFEGSEGVGIDAAREAAVERERPDDRVPGGFRVDTEEGEIVPRGAAPISLGAGLGIDDFDAVAALGAACDHLGVDVIESGSAVSWTVLAAEAGIVDESVEFGDEAAARDLVERIAGREDPLADALADGVAEAAAFVEREAGADDTAAPDADLSGEELVPTVKAMALPGYDPRGAEGMALAYATSDRGGCHRRARPVEEEVFHERTRAETVREVAEAQTARSVLWSLVADDFLGDLLRADLGAEWLQAVGIDHDAESLARTGERIWTLIRLFNAREGFDRADDDLPARLRQARADGAAVDPEAFQRTLEAYYEYRGWGRDGLPTRELVGALDLDGVVDAATPLSADAPVASAGDATLSDDTQTE